MLGNTDLPDMSAEPDSTPSQMVPPDHLAPGSEAAQAPDASSFNFLPSPRSSTRSDGTSFLSPVFTQVAHSLAYYFDFDREDDRISVDINWAPSVLATIIDSEISPANKQYWLQFFLRFLSIIIMVNSFDPSLYEDQFDVSFPDLGPMTEGTIFESLLSELKQFLAIKDSKYVLYM